MRPQHRGPVEVNAELRHLDAAIASWLAGRQGRSKRRMRDDPLMGAGAKMVARTNIVEDALPEPTSRAREISRLSRIDLCCG